MRVALFAADDFSIPICCWLVEQGMLACLVTQPDRPRGRGRTTAPLPVCEKPEEAGIKIFSPKTLKDEDFKNKFMSLEIDIPLVAAYGLFIPKWIRNWKPFPCVNVHPSLLPRWRGCNPVRRAIMEGDTQTGVTLHFTEKKMDVGDIILTSETIEIGQDEKFINLRDRLSKLAVEQLGIFFEGLSRINADELDSSLDYPGKDAIRTTFQCIEQDDSLSSYSQKIEKSDTRINWSESSKNIHNHIRGMSPVPGARTGNPQKPLKIFGSHVSDMVNNDGALPGSILSVIDGKMLVACGSGTIEINELQPAGKRAMNSADFINGYRIKTGVNLDEF